MPSAGNLKNLEKENLKSNSEPLVLITDHLKNNKSILQDDKQFGYYLAGLIEGSGTFNKETLEIEFEKKDVQALFWLKKRLGVGTVLKKGNKIKLVVKNKKGLENIIKLINGKFLTGVKLNEWRKHEWEKDFNFSILPTFDSSLLTNNFYLAGYFDTCGLFNIEIKPEIKLECKIEEKNIRVLEEIKKIFGGEIKDNKYGTISITQARYFIEYFDKYSLCTLRFIEYIKWRDVYRILQRKEHLTKEGFDKILKLKSSISKLSTIKSSETNTPKYL